MAVVLPQGRQQFFTATGAPAVGWKLYAYIPTTTTPKDTYTDAGELTQNAHPVVADARGEMAIYWSGDYDVVLKDDAGATIWGPETLTHFASDADLDQFVQSLASTSDALGGAAMVGYDAIRAYTAGTVGGALNDSVPSLMSYVTNQTERAAIKAGTSVVDYTSTLNVALAICPRIHLSKGTWNFSSDITLGESVVISGDGMFNTVMKFASSKGLLYTSAASSRVVLRDLTVNGTSKTGTGVKIGDTDFSGQHKFNNVRITGFSVGVRLAASLWTTFYSCLIDSNTTGVDYNAGSGSVYSNATEFFGCVIRANDRYGIGASYTPVRNIGLKYIGGSIEDNGTEAPATYPQVVLGALGHATFNTYCEYGAVGTKPDMFNVTSAGNVLIENCYFSGAGTGVISSSGGSSNITVVNCDFNTITTNSVNLPSCTYCTVGLNEEAATSIVTGTGSTYITDRTAQIKYSSFVGTLTGCTTSPTGTINYTINGDAVTLNIPVIEATSNTTAATITGLPAALTPVSPQSCIGICKNNGTAAISQIDVNIGSTLTLLNVLSTTFTNSGTKGVGACTITYRLTS